MPLLHCDGSCLRAFHPRCLGLAQSDLQASTPWLCNECRQGKPVLHWDPARQEYFYYYYECAESPEAHDSTEVDTDSHLTLLGQLPREAKRKLREEEEAHRLKEMYYDPLWCMWRCKSRDIVKQRDERQKPVIETSRKDLQPADGEAERASGGDKKRRKTGAGRGRRASNISST
jgi:hypothetical protein